MDGSAKNIEQIRSMPLYCIAAGNPAQIVKKLSMDEMSDIRGDENNEL